MEYSLFGTDGIRGLVGRHPLIPSSLWAMGEGIGSYLLAKTSHPVMVLGSDTRESCNMIRSSLYGGLWSKNVTIMDVGVAPTPAISFLVQALNADMGIVISASHNPSPYNGIKFFNEKGEKFTETEKLHLEVCMKKAIKKKAHEPHINFESMPSSFYPGLSLYETFVVSLFPDLSGISVVLDCAHGALFDLAERCFRRCGATVLRVLGASPDGHNINDGVGALYPQSLAQAVCESHADLGFGFDGDGDRVMVVNAAGEVQDGDQILACLSMEDALVSGRGVVGTIMSNLGLEQFLSRRSIAFMRTDVGDQKIAEAMQACGWLLGGEPSGHILMHSILPTGDGLIAALCVAHMVLKKSIGFPVFSPVPSVLKNIPLRVLDLLAWPNVKGMIDRTQEQLQGSGRLLVRCSGTEPLLRLLVEGECPDFIQHTADTLEAYFMQVQEHRCKNSVD